MPFKKGHTKVPGSGLRKGQSFKKTLELKEMIRGALEGVGGQKYLQERAKENPAAFLTLLGKIIPTELKHEGAIGSYELPLTDEQKKAGIDAIMRYQLKHKGDDNVT